MNILVKCKINLAIQLMTTIGLQKKTKRNNHGLGQMTRYTFKREELFFSILIYFNLLDWLGRYKFLTDSLIYPFLEHHATKSYNINVLDDHELSRRFTKPWWDGRLSWTDRWVQWIKNKGKILARRSTTFNYWHHRHLWKHFINFNPSSLSRKQKL